MVNCEIHRRGGDVAVQRLYKCLVTKAFFT